jgi:putative flippase GtrA
MNPKRKMNLRQFAIKGVKFGFIGAIGTVLNLGILFGLTSYAHLYYIYSELIAIIIVFGFNYIGNILVGNIKIDNGPKDNIDNLPA